MGPVSPSIFYPLSPPTPAPEEAAPPSWMLPQPAIQQSVSEESWTVESGRQMGRTRSENWMACSRRTRAMSAREPSFQEYTGWGCAQAIPTSWDLGPGFPSCQAPSSTENWVGLSRLLEGRGRGWHQPGTAVWPGRAWEGFLGNGMHMKAPGVQKGGFPWWLSGKEPSCNAGDRGSTPGSG